MHQLCEVLIAKEAFEVLTRDEFVTAEQLRVLRICICQVAISKVLRTGEAEKVHKLLVIADGHV